MMIDCSFWCGIIFECLNQQEKTQDKKNCTRRWKRQTKREKRSSVDDWNVFSFWSKDNSKSLKSSPSINWSEKSDMIRKSLNRRNLEISNLPFGKSSSVVCKTFDESSMKWNCFNLIFSILICERFTVNHWLLIVQKLILFKNPIGIETLKIFL